MALVVSLVIVIFHVFYTGCHLIFIVLSHSKKGFGIKECVDFQLAFRIKKEVYIFRNKSHCVSPCLLRQLKIKCISLFLNFSYY
jgi:hypothetical protein